jgi:hypothetical protein
MTLIRNVLKGGSDFRYVLSGVIGFALLVGTLRNLYRHWHYRRLRRKRDDGVARPSAMSHVSTIVREKVTLPALRGEDHIRHPQFHGNPYAIPTRINTILLLAFTLLNIFFCCFGFVAYDGNIL